MAPPIRLCCFQSHAGPVCPDGKVMCCLCFGRFNQNELSRDEDGFLTDVCQPCADEESDYYNMRTKERC